MNRLSYLLRTVSFRVILSSVVLLFAAQSPIRRVSGQSGCGSLAVRSAASYALEVAPESIAVGFGANLATREESATTQPLPDQLAGTTVRVKDSAGVERPAPLFYVSPGQVNFLIPAGTATGTATITVTSGAGKCATGAAPITKAAPGLFTANASGQGVPAALALRSKPDGTQIYEPVSPLSLGPENEQIYLILYGTGIRGRNALADVTVQIGGEKADVLFAEAQGGFAGLDQVNAGPVPRRLIGRCKVNLALTINGFGSANLTEIEMAGAGGASLPPIRFSPPNNLRIRALAVISGVTLYAGSFGGGVFKSTNNGQSWAATNSGLTAMVIPALIASGPNLLAGAQGSGIYRSTNDGQSWTPSSEGLPPYQDITGFALIDTVVFAGTYGEGVFFTTDQGKSWKAVNNGLPYLYVRALIADGASLFASTDGDEGRGVFLLPALDREWSAINQGLTVTDVRSLFITNGRRLFAGTSGGGVFAGRD